MSALGRGRPHYSNQSLLKSIHDHTTSPLVTGFIIGLAASAAQAFLQVYPPVAYGLCMVGHLRDFVIWIVNHAFNMDLALQPVSMEIPVLSVIGVLIGSTVAAVRNKEFRITTGGVLSPFMLGFLGINFGLILGYCPIRGILLSAYGNIIGVIGAASIAIGVAIGCLYIRVEAKR